MEDFSFLDVIASLELGYESKSVITKLNKIRDLFKVKLYAIRSETKRERERERVREREKSEREILNVH